MDTCPICSRSLTGDFIQEHHLIPKTFKGKETVRLHKSCHQKIHSVFTERELFHTYNNIQSIIEHPEIIKFVKFIQKKPVDFYDKSDETTIRYSKRWK